MNRIAAFFASLLIVLTNTLFSQTPIGFNYDLNGKPLNGYYDALTYSHQKSIIYSHNSNSFEIGYYYDNDLNKVEGLIKFDDDKILFKNRNGTGREKLKPDEINSFIIGIDSFYVTSNFYYKDKLRTKSEFVQYITTIDTLIFAKNYNFPSGVSQTYGGNPPVVETYLVQMKNSNEWDNFSEFNFRKTADKYFGHIPFLSEKIKIGDFDDNNPRSLIKMADYYYRYQNGQPIYLDKYWQELTGEKNSMYKSSIDNKEDSIWTISYFHDDIKIYQGNYSSFFPNLRDGVFISYYSNGNERSRTYYKNNKQKENKLFYPNGKLKYHYNIIGDSTSKKNINRVLYTTALSPDGEELINNGLSRYIEKDTIKAGYEYQTFFRDKKIHSVFRMMKKDTVYLLTDPEYNFKLNSLQDKFTRFMGEMNIDEALSENAQGTVLVSFVIDPKGNVLDYRILNSINGQLDLTVKSFVLNRVYRKDELGHKFKPFKIHRKKHFCEVVIPFEFDIVRYYRALAYNNQNLNFHNQMMMQQMMHQNNLDHINPPSFPSFH